MTTQQQMMKANSPQEDWWFYVLCFMIGVLISLCSCAEDLAIEPTIEGKQITIPDTIRIQWEREDQWIVVRPAGLHVAIYVNDELLQSWCPEVFGDRHSDKYARFNARIGDLVRIEFPDGTWVHPFRLEEQHVITIQ